MIEKNFLEDQAIRRCDLIIRGFTTFENENMREFAEICKQALEEREQYRAIGTIEELHDLKSRLQSYKNQMSIYAEQHKVILASDVLEALEELEW